MLQVAIFNGLQLIALSQPVNFVVGCQAVATLQREGMVAEGHDVRLLTSTRSLRALPYRIEIVKVPLNEVLHKMFRAGPDDQPSTCEGK